jgi:dipeptidyl aminopeptidase/acylaminoacyl peptidase
MLRLPSLVLPVLCLLLGSSTARAQGAASTAIGEPLPVVSAELPVFTADDVFKLQYADDPQISPDGSQVVFVNRFFDKMSDRVRGNLWVVDREGKQPLRPLLTGLTNYSTPRWSPDGTRILYTTADEEGRGQLYLRWMDTGQTAMLTHFERAPSGFSWSPDGYQIAFTMFVPEAQTAFAKGASKPDGASWAPAPTSHEELQYRSDGRGFLKPGYNHVFVMWAAGGAPRQLTKGPFQHRGTPVWTPDGDALLIAANRREDARHETNDTEIYEVSVEDGAIRALTDRYGPDRAPTISPDGEWIAYTSYANQNRAHQINQLWEVPRTGGVPRLMLNDFDYDVESPVWLANGSGICFAYDIEGDRRVGFLDREGNVADRAVGMGGTSLGRPYTSGAWSVSNAGEVAFTQATALSPADVALSNGRKTRPLTRKNLNLLGQRALGKVTELRWKSKHDGLPIHGWLVMPPKQAAGVKPPLILEIHGGPATAYGPTFSAEIQLYAAAGYAVLYCNPRGSTSYGQDFADAIYQAYPGHDYEDLMSGVDLLVEQGTVDPEQLFVTGGSGGGLLSAWIVTQTDRFAAAAIAKPVINWYSFALTSDVGMGFMKRYFPGAPWDHAEQYLARSPIHFVDQVTTPSMLITGEVDWRTPMSESEQFYQALKSLDVDAALIRIPEASHGIAARPSHMIGKVNHILAWFERYRTEG